MIVNGGQAERIGEQAERIDELTKQMTSVNEVKESSWNFLQLMRLFKSKNIFHYILGGDVWKQV